MCSQTGCTVSQSGIINVMCSCTGYTEVQQQILTLNLTNFFLRTLKILNTQKLDNLFIFKLTKVAGDRSKTVIHYFLRVLQKFSKDARSGIKPLIIVPSTMQNTKVTKSF